MNHLKQKLSDQELVGQFEDGETLSMLLSSYEVRTGQIDLLKMVTRAFNEECSLIAEAGTGLGKSLAYLLPALRWAELNDGRVVVSTATIALQQQIVDKDIPLAKKILGSHVKTSLVKGRGNYLCLKRLDEAVVSEDLFGRGAALSALHQWADETIIGTLSDAPFLPEPGIWEQIRCEADSCPGAFCHYFDECFFMKSRRRAAESSLMVVNHYLLFADLATRRDGVGKGETAVLPTYQCIIFDEAHHIKSGATAMLSVSLSSSSLNRLLHRLYRGKSATGIFNRIADMKPDMNNQVTRILPVLIEESREAAQILDTLGRSLLGEQPVLRLKGVPGNMESTNFIDPMKNLCKVLMKLIDGMRELIGRLNDDEEENELHGLVVELEQATSGIEEAVSIAHSFICREQSVDHVFWLELNRTSGGGEVLQCHRTPLMVADMMREMVWDSYKTVIALSATLAISGDFQDWKSSVGATSTSNDSLEGIYRSPFDFSTKVLLGIPTDAPSPEELHPWKDYLVTTIAQALESSEGRALVLFTSFAILKSTINGVRSLLDTETVQLMAQGDADRGKLLVRFRDNPSSVLFATDSFWEGVDIPGESLRLVVITRLPFRPPTNPVDQARREVIANAGGNPFLKMTVPAAVTRFRQGFGRLMRRKDDYGAVLVLDSRIICKSYGILFRDALPKTRLSVKSTEGVLRELEDFLL